jgi:isopentenyldiphosphate isomerase
MWNWVKTVCSHPLFVAVAGGLPGVVLGAVSLYLVHQLGVSDKSREVKQGIVLKFAQTSSDLLIQGGQFVIALNSASNLAEAKNKIRTASAEQEITIDQLSKLFDNKDIGRYADAVRNFASVSESTSTPVQIGAWIQSFNDVVVTRSTLSDELYKDVNI